MIAVFAGGIAQVEFCVVILVKEFLHAVGVIVVRVAQDTRIDFRNVNPHECSILGELRRSSRVEQNALAVEFGVDAKSPFAL